jgi:hypothetical protein
MNMIAKEMRSRFRYEKDGKLDKWVIHDATTGEIVGDCEDHALTVTAMIFGGKKAAKAALWDGDAEIYYTRVNGRGHAVLKYNGCYIDNIHPSWTSTWRYGNKIKYPRWVIAIKLLMAKVL